jgi:ribonuclease HI
MKARIICDGRGNAGTGACAAVAYNEKDDEIVREAMKLNPVTNIFAELSAILLALQMAYDHGIDEVLIQNDSQVPVYLVDGSYKTKKDHLKPLLESIWKLGRNKFFKSLDIEWVPREDTLLADKLCRMADMGHLPADMRLHEFGPREPGSSRDQRKRRASLERKKRPNPFLPQSRQANDSQEVLP